jgi:hypothetical protein
VSKIHRTGRSGVRSTAHLLIAGLAATALLTAGLTTPGYAAGPAAAAAAVVANPTTLADDDDKVEAARVLGINPGIDMLVLNDQEFVLSIWRQARAGSFVKAEALRAYDSTVTTAAYTFIKTGIFAAAADDAQAEIAAERAKAQRRSVAVTVGLDPADTALIELGDRDFIFAVWQRVAAGTHVRDAAEAAIAAGTDQEDWTAFLTTGAQAAREQDMVDAIREADELEAARLRAEQLATAKRALLQLLVLPVTEELVNAPDRQYVLHVKNTAKGAEVQLASQAALNAADADLAQALRDFIFTGGAAANAKDEQAAAAKELAGYRTKATAIRDAAKLDGWLPRLVAAAEQALAGNTLLGLQSFLLKGQDEARAEDMKTWANVSLAGDRIAVVKNDGTAVIKEGGLSAVWVPLRDGVKQVALAGDRIGVLATDGTVYLRDGSLTAPWVTVRSGVKQLVLSGDRIGVITTDGLSYVKAGALTNAWVLQASATKQIVLAGTRIGVLSTAGNSYAKEGSPTAGFTLQASANQQIAAAATRFGVLSTAGNHYVKDGPLTNGYLLQTSATKQIALSGDRIGTLSTAGNAYVKDGAMTSAYVLQRGDVAKLAIDGDRIGVLTEDGTVYAKDGPLNASWVTLTSTGPIA